MKVFPEEAIQEAIIIAVEELAVVDLEGFRGFRVTVYDNLSLCSTHE